MPQSAPLRHSLGTAFQSVGAYKEAAEAYESAIALAPKDVQGYIASANLALEVRNRNKAVWFFRRAHELEPGSFRGQLQLAHALVGEQRFGEAEELLRRLIQWKPKAPAPYGLLAGVLHDLGRFEEANELAKEAIAMDPFNTGLYTEYVAQRKLTESDRPFIETMNRLSKDPRLGRLGAKDLHFAVGKSLNDLGDYKEAMEAFDLGNSLAY